MTSRPIRRLSDGPYYCTTCNKSFTGPASYVEHRDSDRHRKLCSTKVIQDSAKDHYVKCEVCNTEISGAVNLEQHDSGKRHKNAMAAQLIHEQATARRPPTNTSPSIVTSLTISPGVTSVLSVGTTQGSRPLPYLPSSPNLPLSLKASINSLDEHRETRAMDAPASLSGLAGPTVSMSSTSVQLYNTDNVTDGNLPSYPDFMLQPNSGPYQCRTCQKRFTGPVSYAEHKHINLHGTRCFSGTDENYVWCDICKTQISGVMNMEAHDSGKRHRKAMSMLQCTLSPGYTQETTKMCIKTSPSTVVTAISVPAGKTSSLTITQCENVPSAARMLCYPSSQPAADDTNSLHGSEQLTALDSSIRDSSLRNVSPGPTSHAAASGSTVTNQASVQDCSAENERKHEEPVKPTKGKDQEQSASFTSSEATERSFVGVVYSADGTKCKVGDVEGYGCRKCGIILFQNAEAAQRHYRTDGHTSVADPL